VVLQHRLEHTSILCLLERAFGLWIKYQYAKPLSRLFPRLSIGNVRWPSASEQSDPAELSINMNAAKAIGVTLPPALVLRADEVVE
jgi:hypothetical protein